jgi:glutathione S-transferase
MTKLYYAPGACSIGIHIILEELGAPYELEKVNLMEGEQYKPGFLAVNPKSKVPTLERDDGSVLTEFPAIGFWLASQTPGKKLWPSDVAAQTKVLETIDYVVATLHMQGFARLFRPGNFAPDEASQEAVKARGKQLIENGFGLLDKALAGKDWVAGDFSIADAALFYVEFWAVERMKIALPANLAAHYERMKARPAVKAVLKQEGFAN